MGKQPVLGVKANCTHHLSGDVGQETLAGKALGLLERADHSQPFSSGKEKFSAQDQQGQIALFLATYDLDYL